MEPLATPAPAPGRPDTVAAWRSGLAGLVTGLFVFETLTGVLVWLLPFSLSAQFMLLVHTGVGVLWTVPWVWYQGRHWNQVRRQPFTHLQATGYTGLAVLLAFIVTGLILTWQAAFGLGISSLADLIHIASGLAAAGLVGVHLGAVIVRDRKRLGTPEGLALRAARRRFGLDALACLGGAALVVVVLQASYEDPDLTWKLPEGYGFAYGTDRPFAPSLASTGSGQPLHPQTLAGSASCGYSGCHEQIYEEWLPSAHRYASTDVAFQAVQKVMASNEGPESTRYCAGCHDPIALFSGSKNIYDEDLSSPGAEEGVSCVACHRLLETDVKGNASYVMGAPDFYAWEQDESPTGRFLSGFLIRAWPRHHATQYSPPLLREPEYCGACHKQFIDEEINEFGWVQLQNQYDNWRKSHWNRSGDPSKREFCNGCHERKGVDLPPDTEGRCTAISVSCRDCHMRLSASHDPAAGDALDLNRSPGDGMHRNHRFIGANQFMPHVLGVKGADEQVRLTEEWLQGRTVLPEIGHKWPDISEEWLNGPEGRPARDARPSGPVIPVRIRVEGDVARAGEDLRYSVEILSRKVGHDFPTGPLDVIQCWVETVVTDADGKELYHSGGLTPEKHVEEGAFLFKAEGVDAQGNLIDRHNLWELVGARFKRALFPGFTDTAEYQFQCPSEAKRENELPADESHQLPLAGPVRGPLTVTARLLYRKINQHLLTMVTGNPEVTAPITVMSSDEVSIPVQEGE